MSDQAPGSAPGASLPDAPSLEWLRKQAKRRLGALRAADPHARLADAQLAVAREHGFPSWRALHAHVVGLGVDGQLFEAARTGDVATLRALLDEHPARLHARKPPYGHTLLHAAAHVGRLEAVDLLLARGLSPNVKEQGDDTYPMHWAAAAGHVDVVRRLADAGGDVVGRGDDHELEVIGWATCWDGCDDDAHRAVVDVLLAQGARHHVYSAIAMSLADEVRRIVADDPAQLRRPMSRNENRQLPLHFAVRMNRAEMVELLLDLGADPAATDGDGMPTLVYAARAAVGRPVLETLARHMAPSLFLALAMGDEATAARLLDASPDRGASSGALHMLAKRGDAAAVRWLLARGADADAVWGHWEARVTALHLAIMEAHVDVVHALLDAGASTTIRDSQFDSDALGWAEFFGRAEMVKMIGRRRGRASSAGPS